MPVDTVDNLGTAVRASLIERPGNSYSPEHQAAKKIQDQLRSKRTSNDILNSIRDPDKPEGGKGITKSDVDKLNAKVSQVWVEETADQTPPRGFTGFRRVTTEGETRVTTIGIQAELARKFYAEGLDRLTRQE